MTDRPTPDEPQRARFDADHLPETDSVVRHEEELVVDTHRVQTGRVRLRKRLVEEEQTFTVTVRHEEVDLIEEELDGSDAVADPGADLDGPADAVDVTASGHAEGADEDDTVEIVLYAERPVVTMERVPVERVRLRRVRTREEQTVTGEVRREDVVIDRDDLRQVPDQPDRFDRSDRV